MSLPPAEVAAVIAAERDGWSALRSLQSDPTVDILRYTYSGGDAARGVAPTPAPVAGLSGVAALVGTLTREEAESRGVGYVDGMRRFEMFDSVEVLLTDLVRYPATTGETFEVTGSYYDASLGQCIVYARLRKGQSR